MDFLPAVLDAHSTAALLLVPASSAVPWALAVLAVVVRGRMSSCLVETWADDRRAVHDMDHLAGQLGSRSHICFVIRTLGLEILLAAVGGPDAVVGST